MSQPVRIFYLLDNMAEIGIRECYARMTVIQAGGGRLVDAVFDLGCRPALKAPCSAHTAAYSAIGDVVSLSPRYEIDLRCVAANGDPGNDYYCYAEAADDIIAPWPDLDPLTTRRLRSYDNNPAWVARCTASVRFAQDSARKASATCISTVRALRPISRATCLSVMPCATS